MKAKEYYQKYGKRIESGDAHATVEMVNSLIAELKELLDIRNVKTDHGLLTAIRQINEKWNAIGRKFDKPTLKPDAFRDNIYAQLGITTEEAARRMGEVKVPGMNIPQ